MIYEVKINTHKLDIRARKAKITFARVHMSKAENSRTKRTSTTIDCHFIIFKKPNIHILSN